MHDAAGSIPNSRITASVARVALFVALGMPAVAVAQQRVVDGLLPNGGDCPAIGTWNESGLCVVDDLRLADGEALEVDNAILWVQGDLEHRGMRLEIRDRLWIDGRVDSFGDIVIDAGARVDFYGGTSSTRRWSNRGLIVVDGTLANEGGLLNMPGGEIRGSGVIATINVPTGFLHNEGLLIIEGSAQHDAVLQNFEGGTLVIEHGAQLLMFQQEADLWNYGTLVNRGAIFVESSGVVLGNLGVFANEGSIELCDDSGPGTLTNFTVFDNPGLTTNCGTVDNSGTINNGGTIGGNVSVVGSITNSGTIRNCGMITSPLSGNPPIPDLDADGDGTCGGVDCAPADATAWAVPGAVPDLALTHDPLLGTTTLEWLAPFLPGGSPVLYDVVTSSNAADFQTTATTACVETADGSDTAASDPLDPSVGDTRYFLVRPLTACGSGPLGVDSSGVPRGARACP